jgi:pyruvate dehydrogenase E2 component (dihydrolipoamide acetyltransferase)
MPITITMPALSPTMTEGKLAKWLKQAGDKVAPGDVIAEIETDKATMEVEAVDEGVLDQILVQAGTEHVAVNSPIAVLRGEGEAPGAKASPAATPVPAPQPAAKPAPVASVPSPAPSHGGDRVFASPLARRLAAQAGIDLAGVKGSGPQGRIVKHDIEVAVAGGKAASKAPPAAATAKAPPAPQIVPTAGFPPFELVPASTMRKTIARRLTEAKQTVPHFYLAVDCEIDKLLVLRKELNAGDEKLKISVNDMIVKASAIALMRVPAANAAWTEEGIRLYKSVDVSVAVATDGGLITPIVRGAEGKGLAKIAAETKDLAARARAGKLKLDEFQGGTFSISNLGMYGIRAFSAVINPPQGAILAVGAGEPRPVVKGGALAIATVVTLTLSSDHRVVDGAVGAEFLKALKALIEEPMTMLL